MLASGGDDEILGLVLLQHQPLHADIILGMAPIAVSYTHLRAHETVLDLVCRLLLEKKKRKKQALNYRIDAD